MDTVTQAKPNPTPRALPDGERPVNLGRHQRLCKICRHPDRHWIEDDFLRWRSPAQIAEQYELADAVSIYRHAHALGLFALRKRNLRSALELIIEQAEEIPISPGALVRAIHVYARIDDDGHWVEPTRPPQAHRESSPEEPKSGDGSRS